MQRCYVTKFFAVVSLLLSFLFSGTVRGQLPQGKSNRSVGARETVVWIDEMDFSAWELETGQPKRGLSVSGDSRNIHGTRYARGVGTGTKSRFSIALKGVALRFEAFVGVDESSRKGGLGGTCVFQVWLDGKRVFDSGLMRAMHAARPVSLNVQGGKTLDLVVLDGPI